MVAGKLERSVCVCVLGRGWRRAAASEWRRGGASPAGGGGARILFFSPVYSRAAAPLAFTCVN